MMFKVVRKTADSITVEDHTKPKQHFEGEVDTYPTITYVVGDSTGIEVGDKVEVRVAVVWRPERQAFQLEDVEVEHEIDLPESPLILCQRDGCGRPVWLVQGEGWQHKATLANQHGRVEHDVVLPEGLS